MNYWSTLPLSFLINNSSWICPTLEYGNIWEVLPHICIILMISNPGLREHVVLSSSLSSIAEKLLLYIWDMFVVCLAGKGRGTSILIALHSVVLGHFTVGPIYSLHNCMGSAEHLQFDNPCNFKTLMKLQYS